MLRVLKYLAIKEEAHIEPGLSMTFSMALKERLFGHLFKEAAYDKPFPKNQHGSRKCAGHKVSETIIGMN
jgi:hypothetical protein